MRELSMAVREHNEQIDTSSDDDAMHRLIAYASPYLFWGLVAGLCGGIIAIS